MELREAIYDEVHKTLKTDDMIFFQRPNKL